MSPELKDHIAAAVVLVCDAKQDPDQVHQLIRSLCELAENEGYMRGLDKGSELVNKHLGVLI